MRLLRWQKNTSSRTQRQSPAIRKSVFSYHSAGSRAASSTVESRPKSVVKSSISRFRWRHLPTMVAALALLVSVAYLSTISPNPRLVLLGQNDSPNLLRSKQVYFDAAQKILKNSLADKSKITVNSDEFSQHMKQQFPELTDVAMTLPLMGRRPVVELVAARPVLRLTSQGQTYVLDENGRVLLKQADAANLVLSDLPEVKDSTNVSVEIGKAALPRESVAFITTFVQQLKSQSVTPVELTLPAQASELRIRLKEVKYYLKASVLTDARVAAGQFFAVKKRLESEGKTPSEYIDVRVEEKVYVK